MSTITNTGDNTLSSSLKSLLPKCDKVDALVGYFYFSGFQKIYKEIQDKKIRILVGMNIDAEILKKVSVLKELNFDDHLVSHGAISRSGASEKYIKEFATIFNDTDEFDSEDSIKAFKVFLRKIQDGTLQVKKTLEPNHAKNYIFHFKPQFQEGGKTPGIVITGSSNLSFSGLEGQKERNRILTEKHYYEEDTRDFENEWNNPDNILITDISISDYFVKELKKKIWLYQLPDPLLLYYRVLDEYFSIEEIGGVKMPSDITGGKYTDLKYQKDAIEMGIDRINRFGGVIVADVVGLGKSIIASAIAYNLDLQTVIITPPHLKAQWEDYRAEFGFNAFVYTTGKVDEALLRHGKSDKKLLIILDEAHKHRNEDTENYKLLHRLCAGNNVMALSATPFNNDPKDIYALIKLFSTPGKSTIKTVENLSLAFNELFTRYKKARKELREIKTEDDGQKVDQEMRAIATELRRMIEPLVIRRSRLDLQEIEDYKEDLEQQGVAFAESETPRALEYDLGELSDLYLDTLNKISPDDESGVSEKFDGVRYKPASYLKPDSKFIEELFANAENDEATDSAKEKIQQITQAQVNVAKFMRRLLVRRFESSVEAFKISLNNMINSAELMLDWYENRQEVPIYKKGSLPDTETLKDLPQKELDEIMNKLEGRGLIRIPASELEAIFEQDLKNDIAVLKRIRDSWKDAIDPKFDFFVESIRSMLQENKSRKIVIFTEFAHTATYLHEKLKKQAPEIRSFKYSADDASKQNKQIIKSNFDAGIDKSEQKDNFDILIATDAISEGFNLHRAGIIINYDIPYNPTRVIQRVGRINRINKKVFDTLYIYNFFPTFTGEVEIRAKTIAVFKKKIIDALLGDDTKIFTKDETLENFFATQYEKAKRKSEGKSWDAKYRNDWHHFKKNQDLVEKVRAIPHRVRIARDSETEGVVVFAKKNDSFVFAFGKTPESVEIISPEEALPLFNGEIDATEKASETSVNFDPVYQVVKKHIFKDNTIAPTKTSKNRQDALGKVKLLGQQFPPAREYAKDVEYIIKELDALPTATLKDIVKIEIKKDPSKAFEEMKKLVSQEYIEKIMLTASRADESGQLVLLSEELIKK